MLYLLDEEEVSPLRLSAQEGLRKSNRKLQIRKNRFLWKRKAMIIAGRERIIVK